MKIISWNTHSLNGSDKQDVLRNLIRDHKPIFLPIQGTKMPKEKLESTNLGKNHEIAGSSFEGALGRVSIVWNSCRFIGEVIFEGENIMLIKFINNREDDSWYVLNVYAPNYKRGR